ncbi:unnamed protein product [Didymodactylos carnosus]|uniref:NAD(P)(+)--arginine ADP-ribosyltransferase n=1 Tax=Didymodactylos carnosus TaxID=1234261 RepID=A0A814I5W5_9BILA|nr:unnamed protein product [Didymodactylos carnosus]CAF1019551.1 unnamed protein product [Didymodactylos carnosus]CAF3721326.1 unnamed protein product [Didymodactylos carnosus]CAF3791014.1 unnamed protein product [Didymodactylos carnosus]
MGTLWSILVNKMHHFILWHRDILAQQVPITTNCTQQLENEASSDQSASEMKNFEEFTVVWLDSDVQNNRNEYNKRKTKIRNIVNHLETFDNQDKCIDYVFSIQESIFFIVSGSFGVTTVPILHDKNQIIFIYIFCADKAKHQMWADAYKKVQGVFDNVDELIIKFQKDAHFLLNQIASISIFDPKERSLQYLTKEQATFIWFQLLIEILLRLPKSDIAKTDMIEECRRNYAGNESQLQKITDFYQNYKPFMAVEWYTKDSFLYRLLNKAFRTQDIETIFKYRYFITDLYSQLKALHLQLLKSDEKTMTVYRGQGMHLEEFEKLKNSVGKFISINTFFSTTTDCEVAVDFAGDRSFCSNMELVVFEIEIDLKNDAKPFGKVEQLSCNKDENEVLFSMGSIFEVVNVEMMTDTLWFVNLRLSNTLDEQLLELMHYFKSFIGSQPTLLTLGLFLSKMDEFDKAEKFYRLLIDELPSDHKDLGMVYNNIGELFRLRGDDVNAMENYEMALALYSKHFRANDPFVAVTQSNIAAILDNRGDYKTALTMYKLALENMIDRLYARHPSVAIMYNNIATVHGHDNDYQAALVNYEKAQQIENESLPDNHPSRVLTYMNIATIHRNIGNTKIALENYKKALDIQTTYLQPNHHILSELYNNYGSIILESLKDSQKALQYFRLALENELRSDTVREWQGKTHQNLGTAYITQKKYTLALENFDKAFEVFSKVLPPTHPSIITNYIAIGLLYHVMHDTSNRVRCLEKAEELMKTCSTIHTSSGGLLYLDLGSLYVQMDDYEKAIDCFSEAMTLLEKDSAANVVNIARVYEQYALCSSKRNGDYTRAIEYYQKAIDIMITVHNLSTELLVGIYRKVASMYELQNDYWSAIECYQNVFEIELKCTPIDRLVLASCYNNFGVCYNELCDYEESIQNYEAAVKIFMEFVPQSSNNLATAYINIGQAYFNMKDLVSALVNYKKSLQYALTSSVKDKALILHIYQVLGKGYFRQADYLSSLIWCRNALVAAQELHAPGSYTIVLCSKNLCLAEEKLAEIAQSL